MDRHGRDSLEVAFDKFAAAPGRLSADKLRRYPAFAAQLLGVGSGDPAVRLRADEIYEAIVRTIGAMEPRDQLVARVMLATTGDLAELSVLHRVNEVSIQTGASITSGIYNHHRKPVRNFLISKLKLVFENGEFSQDDDEKREWEECYSRLERSVESLSSAYELHSTLFSLAKSLELLEYFGLILLQLSCETDSKKVIAAALFDDSGVATSVFWSAAQVSTLLWSFTKVQPGVPLLPTWVYLELYTLLGLLGDFDTWIKYVPEVLLRGAPIHADDRSDLLRDDKYFAAAYRSMLKAVLEVPIARELFGPYGVWMTGERSVVSDAAHDVCRTLGNYLRRRPTEELFVLSAPSLEQAGDIITYAYESLRPSLAEQLRQAVEIADAERGTAAAGS